MSSVLIPNVSIRNSKSCSSKLHSSMIPTLFLALLIFQIYELSLTEKNIELNICRWPFEEEEEEPTDKLTNDSNNVNCLYSVVVSSSK